MSDHVQRIVYELLQYKRAPNDATEAFESKRHNSDLCPALQVELEAVLQMVGKYRKVVYDIQGPQDSGVDVLLRLESDADTSEFLAFQVKAADEAKKEVHQLLKAQYVDAINRFDSALQHYFIVLCWPMPDHHDRVRAVANNFAGIENVLVVEPAFASTFLSGIPGVEMGGIVSAAISDGDPLVDEARKSVAGLRPTQVLILLKTLTSEMHGLRITIDALRNDEDLVRLYEETASLNLDTDVPLPTGTRIPDRLKSGGSSEVPSADDIEQMQAQGLIDLDLSDALAAAPFHLDALRALAYDARARYQYDGHDIEQHLLAVLRFAEHLSTDEPSELTMTNAILYADVDPDSKVDLLSSILSANFSSPFECTENLRGDASDLEVAEDLSWEDVARVLLYHEDHWAGEGEYG